MLKKLILFLLIGLSSVSFAQDSLTEVAYGIEGDILVMYPEGWSAVASGFGQIHLTSGDANVYPYPDDYISLFIQYHTPENWDGDPYEGLIANERSAADYDSTYVIEETSFNGLEGLISYGSFSDGMYGYFTRRTADGNAVQMNFNLPPNKLEEHRALLTEIFNSIQVDPSGGLSDFSTTLPEGAEPSFMTDIGDVCDYPNGVTLTGFQSSDVRYYRPLVTEFGRLRSVVNSAVPGTTITLQLLNPPNGVGTLHLAAERSGFEFFDYGFVLAETAPGEPLTYTFDNRPANYVIWVENGWSENSTETLQLSAICSSEPAANPEIVTQYVPSDWPDATILATGAALPLPQAFDWPYGSMTLRLPTNWTADYGQNIDGNPNDSSFFATMPLNIFMELPGEARLYIYQPSAFSYRFPEIAGSLDEILSQLQSYYYDIYQDGSFQPFPSQLVTLNEWQAAQVDVIQTGLHTRYIAVQINNQVYVLEMSSDALSFELVLPTFEAIIASIQVSEAEVQPTTKECPGFTLPFRLVIGEEGMILPGDPNNINSKPARPSLDTTSQKVGSIPAGGVFLVLDGPVCNHEIAWWYVDYQGIRGWTGEGQGNTYWAAPTE